MRSDAYTIIFTMITSVILGLGLSATRDSLRERQLLNIELDIKKKILSVLGFEQTGWTDKDVQSMYDNNINEIIISSAGEEVKENNVSGQDTYKIYHEPLKKFVSQFDSGNFDIILDDTHDEHIISDFSREFIIEKLS